MAESAKHSRLRAALTGLAKRTAAALRRLCATFTPGIETRQLIFKALGRALLGIWLIWLNPFDLFHKADEASSNLFQYYVSEFDLAKFFVPTYHGRDASNPPIAVVMFTPSALDALTEGLEEDTAWTWPLSFERQSKILDKIRQYNPRAIFYDIEFYQRRDGEDRFHASLATTAGTGASGIDCHDRNLDKRTVPGIPVLFAQPPAPLNIVPKLCNAGTVAASVVWNGRPNVYPFLSERTEEPSQELRTIMCAKRKFPPTCFEKEPLPGMPDRMCESLKLKPEKCRPAQSASEMRDAMCSKEELTPDQCLMLTPAAALFDRMCQDGQKPTPAACFDPRSVGDEDNIKASYEEKSEKGINLVWRSGYNKILELDFENLIPPECTVRAPSDRPPTKEASSEPEKFVTVCPAPFVVGADKLMTLHDKDGTSALQRALGGKIVLIGAEFPGLRDRVQSPYYGLVPGVFAHVTALDNLNFWGPNYIRAEVDERFFTWNRAGEFVLVAALLFIIMYVVERLRNYAPSLAHLAHHQPPTRRHGFDVFIVLAGVALLVVGTTATLFAISALLFFKLRLAPLNWVGELVLVWVFAFEETVRAILLVLLVFPLFSNRLRAFACHLVEKPEEKPHA
jgi:hypothetical protein